MKTNRRPFLKSLLSSLIALIFAPFVKASQEPNPKWRFYKANQKSNNPITGRQTEVFRLMDGTEFRDCRDVYHSIHGKYEALFSPKVISPEGHSYPSRIIIMHSDQRISVWGGPENLDQAKARFKQFLQRPKVDRKFHTLAHESFC